MPRLEAAAAVLLLCGVFAALGGPGQVRDRFASLVSHQGSATLGPASMFGGDAGRTGLQPGPEPEYEFVDSWTLGVEGTYQNGFAPVGLGDTVYRVFDASAPSDPTGVSTRYLEAVDVISGTVRWRLALDVWGSPAVTADLVFVNVMPDRSTTPEANTESDGRLPARLMAIEANTGSVVWTVETGLTTGWMGNVSPIVIGETVYTAAPNGTVYAVEGWTGDVRWTSMEGASAETGEESRTGRPPISGSGQIAAGDGALYVVNTGGEVVAIDASTGTKRWRIAIGERFEMAPETVDLMVVDGMVVLRIRGLDISPGSTTGDQAIDVFATVETATGLGLWRRNFDTVVGNPAIAAGLLIVPTYGTTDNGSVLAINLSSSEDAWTLPDTSASPTGLSVAGNTIFLSGGDGILQAIDAGTGGMRWYIPTHDQIAFPAVVTQEHLLVQGESGVLASFSTEVDATPNADEATPDGDPHNASTEATVVPEPTSTPVPRSGDVQSEATAITINMGDIFFDPEEFTILANTDVTVTVVNNGAALHAFSIDALNVHSGDVQPGASATVTINAPAGDYEFYCPVTGHRQAGMVGTLHVVGVEPTLAPTGG
ncbi:MAG: outer membrane protein assembly factor BamB [Thermomicrobiales bacterium]|nr:outer membrane protein assembly factor BamB [Thermomicrobiales bacterium]